ncbi:MAG TPA: hypothetical protein VHS53_01170 [Mucilaginibacter sp.]|nr:hypothetical protein [Mucilaginibacter sp.]
MKNKAILFKAFVLALVAVSMIWELVTFINAGGHRFGELSRDILLSAAMFGIVSLLFKQQPNDDDWAF